MLNFLQLPVHKPQGFFDERADALMTVSIGAQWRQMFAHFHTKRKPRLLPVTLDAQAIHLL